MLLIKLNKTDAYDNNCLSHFGIEADESIQRGNTKRRSAIEDCTAPANGCDGTN
jgi:hypothetical protein